MTSKGGFTLVEVLVAVMLISILVVQVINIVPNEDKVIHHAISQARMNDKISLFIDKLKVQKDEKEIIFDEFIKNYKLKPNYKKNLSDTFNYSATIVNFLGDTPKNKKNDDKKDKNESIAFKIYKQFFTNKKGYSTSYYRIVRQ